MTAKWRQKKLHNNNLLLFKLTDGHAARCALETDLLAERHKDRTCTTHIKATDVSMTEESAQQQCYADKAEANTKSPRPDARSVFVCVCVCGRVATGAAGAMLRS